SAIQLSELAPLQIQLHEHRDLAAQDFRDYRDRYIIDGADLVAGQRIELADMDTRQQNNGRLLEARMLVNEARRLEAVHVGHADIEQHHGKLLPHEPVERLEPRAGRDEIPAESVQYRFVGEQPR